MTPLANSYIEYLETFPTFTDWEFKDGMLQRKERNRKITNWEKELE